MVKGRESMFDRLRQHIGSLIVLMMIGGIGAYWAWNEFSDRQFEVQEYDRYVKARNSWLLDRLYKHEESIKNFNYYVSQVDGPNGSVYVTPREKELAAEYLQEMIGVTDLLRRELDRTMFFSEFRLKLQQHLKSSEYRTGAVCEDGTISDATGSGACSSHNGVKQWITKHSISHPHQPLSPFTKMPSNVALLDVRSRNEKLVEDFVRTQNEENARTKRIAEEVLERESFTIGSSRVDVYRSMGTPSGVYTVGGQEVFSYGLSRVTMENGIVTGYNNTDGNLRVSGVGESSRKEE